MPPYGRSRAGVSRADTTPVDSVAESASDNRFFEDGSPHAPDGRSARVTYIDAAHSPMRQRRLTCFWRNAGRGNGGGRRLLFGPTRYSCDRGLEQPVDATGNAPASRCWPRKRESSAPPDARAAMKAGGAIDHLHRAASGRACSYTGFSTGTTAASRVTGWAAEASAAHLCSRTSTRCGSSWVPDTERISATATS